MKTSRVTIPVGSFHISGGVKVLVLLANAMARRGRKVLFLAPDYGAECPFPLEPGVSVRTISCGPRFLPKEVRQIFYYLTLCVISARETDMILPNYYLTAYCAYISGLLQRRKPEILWYLQAYEAGSHGTLADAGPVSRFFRYHLAKLSYRLPVRIFCVSNWVKERIGRPDAKVAYPPALNLAVFKPSDRRPTIEGSVLTVGTIGRRGATKGYGNFLKTISLIASERILVLVASPAAEEVPLPPNVPAERVHATTEEQMAAFYNRCDLFVLTSLMEGFPLPPLEAMACGCTVVVTACGGVSEYARDKVNCLVVPPDDPSWMAKQIRRLFRNPALRAALAEEGVRSVHAYGREELAGQFLDRLGDSAPPQELTSVVK